VATLREGQAERVLEGGPGLDVMARDSTVIAELRSATNAERPQERLLAADMLGRLEAAEAIGDVHRLCSDDDPAIRRVAACVRSIRRYGRKRSRRSMPSETHGWPAAWFACSTGKPNMRAPSPQR
jgi:hypothetical protein